MGTHGFTVFRCNGCYYAYEKIRDSYPTGLGLHILHRIIPRNVSRERFEKWVRDTRCEQILNGLDGTTEYVLDEPPGSEWVYEIDLDNLVFHVHSQPLFPLDNMPPDDIFLKSISCDHFGNTALHELTPAQFRYDWRAPPPSPLPESLAAYNRYNNRSSTSSVHHLLRTTVALSTIERVRIALVQLLVTMCMADVRVCRNVHALESVPDRDDIPESMLKLALSLVNFAVGPPIPSLPCTPYDDTRDFVWVCNDVCLRITTHLDDEENLKASIGDLVHHINASPEEGIIYGIACSIFHCALVRVDKDEPGTPFTHTPALQFLPSFYARTMFTPGIEALSRLGCQANGVDSLNAISDLYDLPHFTHKELSITESVPVAAKVSVEVWTRVGDFLALPADLVTLASISPQAMSAAGYFVRYPWVEEFRLVDVITSDPIPPIPETTEDTDDDDIQNYRYQLGRATFTAVKGGRRINIELNQSFSETRIKVQTYLSGRDAISLNELFISELDDYIAS